MGGHVAGGCVSGSAPGRVRDNPSRTGQNARRSAKKPGPTPRERRGPLLPCYLRCQGPKTTACPWVVLEPVPQGPRRTRGCQEDELVRSDAARSASRQARPATGGVRAACRRIVVRARAAAGAKTDRPRDQVRARKVEHIEGVQVIAPCVGRALSQSREPRPVGGNQGRGVRTEPAVSCKPKESAARSAFSAWTSYSVIAEAAESQSRL